MVCDRIMKKKNQQDKWEFNPSPLPADLSDEELFSWAMQDVRRLPEEPEIPMEREPCAGRRDYDEDRETLKELHSLVRGEIPFDSRFSEEYIEAALNPAATPLLRRLRRGEFAIEDTLDLHRMDREEARRGVESFIHHAVRMRKGCVKIIHGRGHNSKENRAILKELLQHWLATRRMNRFVLAYTSARPCDGGYGAVYVLLRRNPKATQTNRKQRPT